MKKLSWLFFILNLCFVGLYQNITIEKPITYEDVSYYEALSLDGVILEENEVSKDTYFNNRNKGSNNINQAVKMSDLTVDPVVNLIGVSNGGTTSYQVGVTFNDPQGITTIKEGRYKINNGDYFYFDNNRRFIYPGNYYIQVEDLDGHITSKSFTIIYKSGYVSGNGTTTTLTVNCQQIDDEQCAGSINYQQTKYIHTLKAILHPNSIYADIIQKIEYTTFPYNYYRYQNYLILCMQNNNYSYSMNDIRAWMTVVGTEYYYTPNYFETGGYILSGQSTVTTKSNYDTSDGDIVVEPGPHMYTTWYTPAIPQDVFDNLYQGFTYQVNSVIYEIRHSVTINLATFNADNYFFSTYEETRPVFGGGEITINIGPISIPINPGSSKTVYGETTQINFRV